MFDKRDTSIQWSKNSLFNKWYWENWTGLKQCNNYKPLSIKQYSLKVQSVKPVHIGEN